LYKIIKKGEDGNSTDRPNQDNERHVSGLLNLVAPNNVILNILNKAREFDDLLKKKN